MDTRNAETKLMRKVSYTERYAIVRLPREWLQEKRYVIVVKTDDKITIRPVK